MNENFQFAGTCDGTFDAVSHRGDFATNGLANREDGLLGHVFRLSETERHFGHATGDDAHFLRAPDHHGHDPEEDDRNQNGNGSEDQGRRGGKLAEVTEVGNLIAEGRKCQADTDEAPDRREHKCAPERCCGRTALERIDQVADVAAVIVGCRWTAAATAAARCRRLFFPAGAAFLAFDRCLPGRGPFASRCLGRFFCRFGIGSGPAKIQLERFFDCGQCRFRRIFHLRGICHFRIASVPYSILSSRQSGTGSSFGCCGLRSASHGYGRCFSWPGSEGGRR